MDLTIHVKVELVETPALINCLSAFCDCVDRCSQLMAGGVPAAAEPQPVPRTEPVAKTAVEAPSVVVQPAEIKDTKKYTIDDFRTACVPLMDAQPDIGPKIQAIIKGFGVNSLVDIPAEKYGELAAALRGLGAQL